MASGDRRLQAVREQLEQTRVEYRGLIGGLRGADLELRPAGMSWTNRQIAWHIAYSLGRFTQTADSIRRGGGNKPPPPLWALIGLWLSLGARIRSARATRASVLALFERGHAAALSLLDEMQAADWQRRGVVLGAERTPADLYAYMREHFVEHAAAIRSSLA